MSRRAEQLLRSDVFLVFVSKFYLKDVKNKDKEITEQMSMAKEFDKPTFLIYLNLSEGEIKEADELFREHKVVKTLTTTKERFKRESPLFAKEMREWCDQNLSNEGSKPK